MKIRVKLVNLKNRLKSAVNNTIFGVQLSFAAAKVETTLMIAVFVLNSLTPIITAFALKMIINDIISAKPNTLASVTRWIICFFAALLFQRVVSGFSGYISNTLRKKFEANIDIMVMRRVIESDLSFFDSPKELDALQIIQNEFGVINSVIFVGLRVVSSFISLLAIVGIMFSFSIWLTLLLIIAVIPGILSEAKFNFIIWQYDWEHSKDYRRSNSIYDEASSPNKAMEFRLYDMFNAFKGTYHMSWQKWYDTKEKLIHDHAIRLFFTYIIQLLSTAAVFIAAIYRFSIGLIKAGDVQFYVNIATNVRSNVLDILSNVTSILVYSEKVNVVKSFLKRRKKHVDKAKLGTREFPDEFEIAFENVSFKYPGTENWILKNCDFTIKKKEKVALVGLNGAGKSTILKLLLGFYKPNEGQITINGISITEYDAQSINRHFSAAFQDSAVYQVSLKENIILSDIEHPYDENRMLEAARFAGVDEIAETLPAKYETQLFKIFDPEGFVPSGGQAQKIALARTIYRDADIVILDEPSATLDPEAEYAIFNKYSILLEQKTTILISHRLANVVKCDKIIVIGDGCILETGSHTELMRVNGKYAYLFKLQAEKYTEDV